MPTLNQLEAKVGNFTSIMEGFGMKMDKQSNQFKLLHMKIALLETKVEKLQRDVSFMHSWSMQGAPPRAAPMPVL